jgi:cytochrome c oxidase subunit 3
MSTLTANRQDSGIHPKMFALWLAIASMIMFFAAFTSAYIVKRASDTVWDEFVLPSVFGISTLLIIANSLSIQWARYSLNKDKPAIYKLALMITLLLSSAFIYSQWLGWQEMTNIGVLINGSPSGSFIYVITGAHALHLAGGMVFLLVALGDAVLNYSGSVESLIYETSPKKKLRIKMLSVYWHFLGALWIYLYLFLYLNN